MRRVADDHLAAEDLRRSLRTYIRAAWPIVEPGTPFSSNWHIDAISDHLAAVTRGELTRLIVNIPPRHMKSLGVSVFWPTWEWLTWPERRFLYASYAQRLSTRDSLICRRLIESPGVRDSRVPDSERSVLERLGYGGVVRLLAAMKGEDPWTLTGDQATKQRFENTRTGYRIATSVGGVATGEGGDRVVVDDPHSAQEAQSDTTRESALEWWDQTMSARLNQPSTGAVVIVMQRLHERDLTGHLIAQGGYEVLCLPAEYEPNHPFIWPKDPRTKEGELLWKDRIDRGSLDQMKVSLGSYGAAGQLQQRPAPDEGGILKRSWWRWWHGDHSRAPHFDTIVQIWDMAFKDTDGSDYVVGQVWGKFGADKYLLCQVRRKLEFTETVEAVINLTAWVEENYPARKTHSKLVEDKANGPAVISQLRRRVPGMVAVNPSGEDTPLGKVGRARAVAPDVEAANVYLPGASNADGTDYDPTRTPDWVKGLVDECAAFPNSAHDDQVDALSQALMRLAGQSGGYRQKGGKVTRAGGMRRREL